MAEEQDPQEVRLGARMATEGNPCGRISRSRTRHCLVRSVLACTFACLFLSRSANSFPSTEPPPVWLKPGRGDTQGLSTLNQRSDNVSVFDVGTKRIKKVIDLTIPAPAPSRRDPTPCMSREIYFAGSGPPIGIFSQTPSSGGVDRALPR